MSEQLRPQPQAGDVWQKPEGTFCFVQNADFGKLKWCYGCGGWDYVDNDPVREKMKEAVLRWREGKSYPPASQPPAGEMITVPCAVFYHGNGVMAVHGHTEYDIEHLKHLYTKEFVASVEIEVPGSLSKCAVPVLPAVTAGETVTP